MMSSVKIITDSACELNPEFAHKYDIDVVPIEFTFDGQLWLREWLDITPAEFYNELRERGTIPKTSQPSTQTYIDAYSRASDGGNREVINFSITSKFSGSYNGSVTALEQYKQQCPNIMEIRSIDSRVCTWGQGELIIAAAEMAADGMPIDEIIKVSSILSDSVRVYTTCDDLNYLRKNGRVGKAGALAGGILQIKPMMCFFNGEMNPLGKVRGRKKSIIDQATTVANDMRGVYDDYIVYPIYGDTDEECAEMAKVFADCLDLPEAPPIRQIGTVIGSHIGPTVLALGYIKKWRKVV